ncbi:MAG TPA: hypothetical protein PLR20_03220 [Syntrophales bacterium]|nr:hypothetical protein [Syntrophales bacterium]HOX95430.1 hypothetical protein [Syntrophales bacterium]HPI56043.1 hypothetical protein [Syntrophales bacterium]HPN24067.1 hypothetical protein [Syntrophales bacterium]HQM28346.1 hypothetical protein [Syntrophales bacterium]
MASQLPEGEEIRRAIKWISELRETQPDRKLSKLVEEAALRFDLSPQQTDFLYNFFTKKP